MLPMLPISDFMRDFYQTLYSVAPEEVKREISKQERVVKHTLYMIMSQHELFDAKDARHFQERFHVRIDQMASDYHTWKKAGCKAYAKPKQFVSGRVAGASKKAFDQVLNTYILKSRAQPQRIIPKEVVAIEETKSFQDLAIPVEEREILPEFGT